MALIFNALLIICVNVQGEMTGGEKLSIWTSRSPSFTNNEPVKQQ
jgi:hypothetical protein